MYDVQEDGPQLRIENRVLPSGPTAVDMIANAAFYYGLVRAVVDGGDTPWRRIPFAQAASDKLHRFSVGIIVGEKDVVSDFVVHTRPSLQTTGK